jgi:hypothetical protein
MSREGSCDSRLAIAPDIFVGSSALTTAFIVHYDAACAAHYSATSINVHCVAHTGRNVAALEWVLYGP